MISDEAHRDIESIFEYISHDSIKYANQTLNNIYSSIYELGEKPYLGRYVPELFDNKYREIIYKSYRIIYEIFKDSNIIYIHFVVHSRRNFKSFYKAYIKNNF